MTCASHPTSPAHAGQKTEHMHRKLLFPLLAGLMSSRLLAVEVVILEEDFEGAGDKILPGGPQTTTQIVADPEAGGTRGNVMEVTLDGTAVWGGLNTEPLRFPLLPLGISPGTDDFVFTADIYIPSDTSLLNPDTTGIRLRWTDEFESGKTEIADQPQDINTIARDEWVTLTLSGVIPASFGPDSNPTTHIRPIYSLYDNVNADAVNRANGRALYLDNFKIIANTSGEDPNILSGDTSPFGIVDSDAGIITRSHTINNSGLNNDLVIADTSSITGDDAAQYAITTPLPMTIPPGGSGVLDLTFDTAVGTGSYSAILNINSNDLADPTVTVDLAAVIVDPTGTELILNGDFEFGNTEGFTTPQTLELLSAPDDPVHTGNHAAVFTLPGGNEWNSFLLDLPETHSFPGDSTQIPITDLMVGQPYRFSCWLYRPSVDGLADEDSFRFIIRWNGATQPDSGPWTQINGGDLPVDTWVQYIEEDVVPTNWPLDPPGAPVTSAHFIFSTRDVAPSSPGAQLYVDDIEFTVDALPPPIEDVYPEMIDVVRDGATGHPTITWTSAPDQTYRLEYSTDLENWVEVDDEYAAEIDSDTTSWTDTTANGIEVRYYRVHLNLPPPPAE